MGVKVWTGRGRAGDDGDPANWRPVGPDEWKDLYGVRVDWQVVRMPEPEADMPHVVNVADAPHLTGAAE